MSLYATGICRIITEPEAKYFESGTNVVTFVAAPLEGKDKSGNYINNSINAEAWGKNAEVIANYCKKGSLAMFSGQIKLQTWEDKNTGEKRSKNIFSIGRVELLPRANGESDGAAAPSQAPPAAPNDDFIPF